MRFFKTLAVCAVVLSGLVGCMNAGPDKATMARHAQAIQSIGVASAVGDRLQYEQFGVTIFDSQQSGVDISNWGFVEFIEGILAQQLSSSQARHTYTVAPIFVDRSKRTAREIAAAASANRAGDPLDAYVIVEAAQREPAIIRARTGKSPYTNYIGGNRPEDIAKRAGMGIFRSKVLGSIAQYVYVTADLVLIDGRTFEEINRVPFWAYNPKAFDGQNQDGVLVYNDTRGVKSNARWPAEFHTFQPDQLQGIADVMSTLMQMSAGHSLREIGLIY